MCFITHNRLIIIIALLSISIGLLAFASSALIIHHADELGQVTKHIKFLLACTFCTLGAGVIQTLSAILYITRIIPTHRWISTNALVFGILLLGICTAMVRFQSTLPEGFHHHHALSNRTMESKGQLNLSGTGAQGDLQSINPKSPVNNSTDTQEDDSKEEDDDDEEKVMKSLMGRKAFLLKFYFGVMMMDFLAVPIFLGLVSSKASKFDLKGKSLLETW